MIRPTSPITLAAILLAAATAPPTLKNVAPGDRLAYLKRARIWQPVDVPSMDVRRGPALEGAFAPMQDVTCRRPSSPA